MKVLIADDSIVSRHLLQSTLQKWGYEVLAASDGQQAWNILRMPDPPQIAILDWMMPVLTGIEVCSRVRQLQRDDYTYILLLTSRNQKGDVYEGMNAGADDYVTKPFDPHELQVRVRAGRRIVDLQRELLQAREALRQQATTDALTTLPNRASILETLIRELNRCQREQRPLSCVMVDVDHFKIINDTMGHLVGDQVLHHVANRLKSSIRNYDSIGRYGGEEFLVVLPGADEAAAVAQADRMRKVLIDSPLTVTENVRPDAENKGPIHFTASFGVAVSTHPLATGPQDLLRLADEFLYVAKRQGRNRVAAATMDRIPNPA
jgi:two-component system, cell cycle response regulator